MAVLNLNRPDLIVPLLQSVPGLGSGLRELGLAFELLIGDTGSTDPQVVEALQEAPKDVLVVSDMTYHFSRSNNDLCDGRVRFDHLLLLNNDVLIRNPAPLVAMVQAMDRNPDAGIVGLVLDFPDGRLQHGGVDVVRSGPMRAASPPGARTRWVHEPGRSWQTVAATGAALMIRTNLWEKLGGLDEAYARECQDVDLCLRAARLGYQTRIVDAGRVVHEENGTRPKGEEDWDDRRLFLRRWMSFIEAAYL